MDSENRSENATVCAVVVTYNRIDLLLECLEGLRMQTTPPHAVCIVDNASTNETPEALLREGYITQMPPANLREPYEAAPCSVKSNGGHDTSVYYIRMNSNTGATGGFFHGIRWAHMHSFDWIWIMDDDCEATPDCLRELLKASEYLQGNHGFLCSRVVDPAGRSTNVPKVEATAPREGGYADWERNLHEGIVKVQTATFVSFFVPKRTVDEVGYPLREFFIWGDDTEYSLRISQEKESWLVGRSRVVHKRTQSKPPCLLTETSFGRIGMHRFAVRNNAYITARYRGLRQTCCFVFARLISVNLRIVFSRENVRFKFAKLCANTLGLLAGILWMIWKRPKPFLRRVC